MLHNGVLSGASGCDHKHKYRRALMSAKSSFHYQADMYPPPPLCASITSQAFQTFSNPSSRIRQGTLAPLLIPLVDGAGVDEGHVRTMAFLTAFILPNCSFLPYRLYDAQSSSSSMNDTALLRDLSTLWVYPGNNKPPKPRRCPDGGQRHRRLM